MTLNEQLIAIEAIKKLKARYFRCMDMQDWAGLAETMTDDIDFEHPSIGRHLSSTAVMAGLKKRLEPLALTLHHGSMPEITVHSPSTASGIWSLHSCVMRAGSVGGEGMRLQHGYGRYFDTYDCTAGEWRLKTLRLEHLYKES